MLYFLLSNFAYAGAGMGIKGGSVNNGSGEAEQKIQNLYVSPKESSSSIEYLIVQCLSSTSCSSSHLESKYWNQILFSIEVEKKNNSVIYFSKDLFLSEDDKNKFYKTDLQVGSAIVFNPTKLYIINNENQMEALPEGQLLELLVLALLEHHSDMSSAYKSYMAMNLKLFSEKFRKL